MVSKRSNLWLVSWPMFLVFCMFPIVAAQDAVPTVPDPTPTASETTQVASGPTPVTSDVTPDKKKPTVKGVIGTLGLHHTITVEVDNLLEYLKEEGKNARKFVLHLDGRPLNGLKARWVPGTNLLKFDIKRVPDSQSEWDALLSRPFSKERGFTYPVLVSVGYEKGDPFISEIKHDLVVVNKTWFWVFLAFFGLVFVLFLRLAKKSYILRDPLDPLVGNSSNKRLGTYSLGRTQMAFWFFLVAMSYVLIWMLTNDRDALSESALGLLGISAATGLGAAVVGSSKKSEAINTLNQRKQESQMLSARLTVLESQIAAPPPTASEESLRIEKTKGILRQAEVEKEIQALEVTSEPCQSKGFLMDILSDVNGIALHRFQIVVWTIVLGFIFVFSVYNSLAMPEFSGTLLALMGISGGTYIGFKFPEKNGK